MVGKDRDEHKSVDEGLDASIAVSDRHLVLFFFQKVASSPIILHENAHKRPGIKQHAKQDTEIADTAEALSDESSHGLVFGLLMESSEFVQNAHLLTCGSYQSHSLSCIKSQFS